MDESIVEVIDCVNAGLLTVPEDDEARNINDIVCMGKTNVDVIVVVVAAAFYPNYAFC